MVHPARARMAKLCPCRAEARRCNATLVCCCCVFLVCVCVCGCVHVCGDGECLVVARISSNIFVRDPH